MKRLVGGALALVLGCQGTGGGVLPDARTGDAAVDAAADSCPDTTDWATRAPRPIAPPRVVGAIAVDEAYAYWTEPIVCADSFCFPGPIVLRAPLAGGGEPEVLFDSEDAQPGSLAVTRDYLFVSIDGQLWRSHKDGSAPEMVAGSSWIAGADTGAIYHWGETTLVRRDAASLEETPVGAAMATAMGPDLQLVGDAAWWLDPEPLDVWRMPLATGAAEIAVQLADKFGTALAVSATGHAFLITGTRDDRQAPPILVRVAVEGGEPEPIAELWDYIHEVVADDTHVYWVEPSIHRLSRMALEGGCIESRDLEVSHLMAPAAEGIIVVADGIALIER